MSAFSSPLIEIHGLSKRYPVGTFRRKMLHAVDQVDLTIAESECIGLVGESGCGKSTLARVLARLIDPTEGGIRLSGVEVGKIPAKAFGGSPLRRDIQVVFQDPTESLNPGFTVFQAIADPLKRLVGGTGRRSPTGCLQRWTMSGCRGNMAAAIRTSCRAARKPASASRGQSPSIRSFSFSTNRHQHSMSPFSRSSSISCRNCRSSET